jgi:drug/metabolite transporter (DMT)-like permease
MSGAFAPTARVAYFCLAGTMLMWAMGVVIARGTHETIPPVGLAFWRWFGGVMLLLPFVWRDLIRHRAAIVAHRNVLLLLGGLMVLSGAGMHIAVNYTTAINAVLVNAAQPAITAVGAYLLGRDRLRPWQWLGIAAATSGIIIMACRGDWAVLASFGFNTGDIVIFIATFGFSAYALNVHRVPGEMGLFASLFVIGMAGSLLILPVYIFETVMVRPMPFTWQSVGAISTLAVFMTVLSIFLWNAGNRAIGPSRAGIFVNLFPVFVAALAIVFLGEELHLYHLAGAACVCLGITLVVTAGQERKSGQK